MKKIHTFGILLMMILLGSCISSQAGFTNEQLLSIRKGMTLEQVTDVLGSPSYRTFNDKGEEWEFRGFVFFGIFCRREGDGNEILPGERE